MSHTAQWLAVGEHGFNSLQPLGWAAMIGFRISYSGYCWHAHIYGM